MLKFTFYDNSVTVEVSSFILKQSTYSNSLFPFSKNHGLLSKKLSIKSQRRFCTFLYFDSSGTFIEWSQFVERVFPPPWRSTKMKNRGREGGRIEKREDQRVAGFSASEIRPPTL